MFLQQQPNHKIDEENYINNLDSNLLFTLISSGWNKRITIKNNRKSFKFLGEYLLDPKRVWKIIKTNRTPSLTIKLTNY